MKYVMKGNSKTGKLEIPHLIVAQSYKCNYDCVGCNAVGNGEISSEDMNKLIINWTKYVKENNNGKGIFHLKGGEPFLFKDFDKTISKVVNNGLYLFITTNGSIINDKNVEILKEAYQRTEGQIIVSLDGSREKINALSRPKNSYDSVRNTIERLIKNNIPVAWNYRVHKMNQRDIGNAINQAKDLGVTQFNILYHTQIRNKQGNLKIPDLDIILERVEEARNNGAANMLEWSVADMVQKLGSGGYECNSCVAGFEGLAYVIPNGDVYSCPNTVIEKYNLGTINNSFEEIFKNKRTKQLREIHNGILVCKGELEAYNSGSQKLKKLEESEALIKQKISKKSETGAEKTKLSLCFNRNW